jgi:hypothetical protein
VFQKHRGQHGTLVTNLVDIVVARSPAQFKDVYIRSTVPKPEGSRNSQQPDGPEVLALGNVQLLGARGDLIQVTNEFVFGNSLSIYAESLEEVDKMRTRKQADPKSQSLQDTSEENGVGPLAFAAGDRDVVPAVVRVSQGLE